MIFLVDTEPYKDEQCVVTYLINTYGDTDTFHSFQCCCYIQGEDVVKRSYFQICISLLEFCKTQHEFSHKKIAAPLSIHCSWSVSAGVVLSFMAKPISALWITSCIVKPAKLLKKNYYRYNTFQLHIILLFLYLNSVFQIIILLFYQSCFHFGKSCKL